MFFLASWQFIQFIQVSNDNHGISNNNSKTTHVLLILATYDYLINIFIWKLVHQKFLEHVYFKIEHRRFTDHLAWTSLSNRASARQPLLLGENLPSSGHVPTTGGNTLVFCQLVTRSNHKGQLTFLSPSPSWTSYILKFT
jgi:hypothetical protein